MSVPLPGLPAAVPVQSPTTPIYPTMGEVVLKGEMGGEGLKIQSGKIDLTSNGQIVVLPEAYTSSMQVFVQGTANKAGVNGFFTIATYGSLTEFRVFYSGELIYGAIEVFWLASGE
jgi:hypothetical protein